MAAVKLLSIARSSRTCAGATNVRTPAVRAARVPSALSRATYAIPFTPRRVARRRGLDARRVSFRPVNSFTPRQGTHSPSPQQRERTGTHEAPESGRAAGTLSSAARGRRGRRGRAPRGR
eukprot:31333-Pelagococcus_subviridis.AAC.13